MSKKIFIVIFLIIVVLGGWWFLVGNGGSSDEAVVVRTGELRRSVSVSGRVVPAGSVELGFIKSGEVASVAARVGERVQRGAELARLKSGTLQASLQAARADLALVRAEAENTAVNLDEIRAEQATIVENLSSELLSEGLAAVPTSANYSVTAPTITGRYHGAEGTYKIIVARRQGGVDNYELRVFELEKVSPVKIFENEPTPLGTRGLFISFPDDLAGYQDTIWRVTIPNTKSDFYLINYNRYEEALRTRDLEIARAEAELIARAGGTAVTLAEIARAEAEVERIEAELAEQTIHAPFAGVITAVEVEVGEIVGANEPAITLISGDNLEIESFVPEINVAVLKVGDSATVTLDAYGEEVEFAAMVIAIDPAETLRDGVSTYKATLRFLTQDERIKPGMTANVEIVTLKRDGVILLPEGLVSTFEGEKFVRIKNGEQIEKRIILVGERSSFGEVEVLSGLLEGEVVLAPIAAD